LDAREQAEEKAKSRYSHQRQSAHHPRSHANGDPEADADADADADGTIDPNEPAIIDYLHTTSISLCDDTRQYEHVWTNVLRHTPEQVLANEEQMLLAMQAVNRNITPNDFQYCRLALGIADEASQKKLALTFRLFCVLAALSERFQSAQYPGKDGVMEEHNGQMIELKISQARTLFYLSDGAKQDGVMSLEEFHQTCLAGQVHSSVSQAILGSLDEQGKDCLEFLDFLVYLPVFLRAHDSMLNNPFA
jgi:hypothetical protein